ncbi:MAG: hypothetical protein K5894_01930, partial [Lachnospiraceae bacterium]|nr:hypothetical protein [Lachnospiraceae bacterium]
SAMIVKTDDGLVWAGHDKGVSAFDSSFNEEIRLEAPEIPAGRVNTLYTDEKGLWAGSQEGAAHLSRKNGKWEVSSTRKADSG